MTAAHRKRWPPAPTGRSVPRGRFYKEGERRQDVFLLVVDPVAGKIAYIDVKSMRVSTGRTVFRGRVWYSSFEELPSGYQRVQSLLRKWWRVDAKLLWALSPRLAIKHYAREVTIECEEVSRVVVATMDALNLYFAWASVAPSERGSFVLVPLFDVIDLQLFLRGEASYKMAYEALRQRLMAYEERMIDSYRNLLQLASDIVRSVVERLPSSYEIIEDVLSRYNVTAKDILDFAVSEAIIREVVARAQQQQPVRAKVEGPTKAETLPPPVATAKP